MKAILYLSDSVVYNSGGKLFGPKGNIGNLDALSWAGSSHSKLPKLSMGLWVGREQCFRVGQVGKARIMGLGHRAVTAQG